MSDVRDAAAPTTGAAKDTGGFIWYELMTTDAAGPSASTTPLSDGASVRIRSPPASTTG